MVCSMVCSLGRLFDKTRVPQLCPKAQLDHRTNLATLNSDRSPIEVQDGHCCPKKGCWELLNLDHREAVLSSDLGKIETTLKGKHYD